MGHLLGSACIEVFVKEGDEETKLVFSGDIGNTNQPLIKDPAFVTDADYVIVESTYGDRLHHTPPDYAAQLADTIQRTFDRGGNVIIPSFCRRQNTGAALFHPRDKSEAYGPGTWGFFSVCRQPACSGSHAYFQQHGHGQL